MNTHDRAPALESRRRHAALAQLHRWFQFYERPDLPLEHQLELLRPDVRVRSGLGEAVGHAAYVQRVSQLPKTWSNAHFVVENDFVVVDDQRSTLRASVQYLNVGLLPAPAVRRADLRYTVELLAEPGSALPRFESVAIEQLREGRTDTFRDAYPENRLKSLLHRWLAIVDDPAGDPRALQDVLAAPFSLHFDQQPITDIAGLQAWLGAAAAHVTVAPTRFDNFSYSVLDDRRWTLQVELDASHHHLTVRNDPTERFARIERMEVRRGQRHESGA
jgi:hypothetical protein